MTRKPTIVLFVVAAALLGETQVSNAQQSAYSYPWCSLGAGKESNSLSCYYTSWEQCKTTTAGVGGYCVESPYYRSQPTQLHNSVVKPHHRKHVRTAAVR